MAVRIAGLALLYMRSNKKPQVGTPGARLLDYMLVIFPGSSFTSALQGLLCSYFNQRGSPNPAAFTVAFPTLKMP